MPAFSKLAQRTPFYYGWVVAGVVALTMMLSGAVAAPMFSVLIPAWEEEFGWSRTAISGAFSFGTIIAALTGPFAGRSLDKYSGRLVMGGGSVLIAASLIGLGFATSLVALYVIFSVGRTALMGIQNLGGHTVIANWFVRRRTFATAVAVNGSRVGLGIWPLLAAAIITTFGWREALWTLGAIVGLLSLVPLVLIVARQPEDVGLHPDGRPLSAPQPGQEAIMGELEPRWRAREAVRTSAFWFLLAAHMGAMVVGGGFGVHRISLFLDRGLSSGWVGPGAPPARARDDPGRLPRCVGDVPHVLPLGYIYHDGHGFSRHSGRAGRTSGSANRDLYVPGVDGFRRHLRDASGCIRRLLRASFHRDHSRHHTPPHRRGQWGRAYLHRFHIRFLWQLHVGVRNIQCGSWRGSALRAPGSATGGPQATPGALAGSSASSII